MPDRIHYTKIGEKLFNVEKREDTSLPTIYDDDRQDDRVNDIHKAKLNTIQKKLNTLFSSIKIK